jgi:hypothetical protein
MTPAHFLFPARRLRDLLHRETTDLAATVHRARALAADLVDAIEAVERRRHYMRQFDGEEHRVQHPGRGQSVLVRCRFFRSAFPSERIFVIRARDGSEWRGMAPLVQYCTNRDGRPLGDKPTPADGIEGYVMGFMIGHRADGTARVYLPDGEVYELGEDLIVPVRDRDAFPGAARKQERSSTDDNNPRLDHGAGSERCQIS